MNRVSALIIVVILLLVSLHSGKTDGAGGHYNHSTGDYHYHHGYSAHRHYDIDGDGTIDCPFEFKDNTTHNNSSSNKQDYDTDESPSESEDRSEETSDEPKPKNIGGIIVLTLAFSFPIFLLLFNNSVVDRIKWKIEKLRGERFSEEASSRFTLIGNLALAAVIMAVVSSIMRYFINS